MRISNTPSNALQRWRRGNMHLLLEISLLEKVHLVNFCPKDNIFSFCPHFVTSKFMKETSKETNALLKCSVRSINVREVPFCTKPAMYKTVHPRIRGVLVQPRI
ncbi:hypothetical protein AVEN_38025-1 [Araneus ventricosus]|uniref:Uncharacterized protein n=1 Tax=Araneus ventricosus TaxID=182803 RepID=A0A4Y2UVL6_ARAVE|nr:hypothetical protein AVEN_38025-1 [Araneus ventricosus]